MTRTLLSPLVLLVVSLTASAQTPLDFRGKTLAATFDELLPGMSATNEGARSAAQQRWQDICFALGAPGNEKLCSEACTLMAAKLDAKTPKAARLWLIQQLQRIGREESVAALAVVTKDPDDEVREAAVRALANNPSPTATGTLIAALGTARGNDTIGILNALGHRKDAKAVTAIATQLASEDAGVAAAAARALGRIHTPDSTRAIAVAYKSATGAVREACADALLVHADQSLKNGDHLEPLTLYTLLYNEDKSRAVHLAALRGLIQCLGDSAGTMVLGILAGNDTVLSFKVGDDPGARDIALGQIESLNAAALKTLAESLDKLSVATRVAVITAIAARGDRTQLPVALAAAKSAEADVKRAGLRALGRLGDASTVEFLLDVMTGKDANAGIAAESLAALAVDGVNEKIAAVLDAEKVPARSVALIGILERRRAADAVPAILKAATQADAGVRSAAFSALKVLATPKDVPAMLAAHAKTAKGPERDHAEVAIVAVLAAVKPDKRAEPVLALFADATGNRVAELLPLVGRLGGPEALKVMRETLASTIRPLHDAAVVGLCNWPDATANDELLAVASKDPVPANKDRAVKALIRINTVLIDRTPEEKLAALSVLKQTMKLAAGEPERRSILEGLGNVRHIETLHYLLPYLDQPDYVQAACKGIVELAHSKMLREPNKAEFDKALDRVLMLCKDKWLLDRAKQYKEGR